ncbi:alpha/beta hydrolase [Pusillimonas caeni]|uniref:alpha/beta fold hydrolase n=1 Tax=Pusillimonas caeni TaxID=1348472 RepID=UPI000E59F51B|nr:alpha/beta hydrolase [Pusillimonas caeni]TFL15643.1 alpha/beta hydrolase [Pusillimonas caeni]
MNISSCFIQANRIRTHYLEAGSGAPLLLLHGGGAGADSVGNWKECIKILAKRYRVIAPDMVGFGKTDKPSPENFTYDQKSRNDHIVAFIEALGLTKVAVVGNSMGGATALGVALQRPELLDRIVLMGSAGLAIPPVPSPHLQHTLNYDFTLEGMRRVIEGLTSPRFKPTVEMIRYRYELMTDPAAAEALKAINAETKKGTLVYDEDALRTIKHPVLVVNGKEDGVSPIARALRFLELLENSRGYIVPHCGHWAMIETTAEFCSVVENFLALEF